MVPHIINHPERLNQHKTTDTTLIAAPSDRASETAVSAGTNNQWTRHSGNLDVCSLYIHLTLDGKLHQINTALYSSAL